MWSSVVFAYLLLLLFSVHIILLYFFRWRTDKQIYNRSLSAEHFVDYGHETAYDILPNLRGEESYSPTLTLLVPSVDQADQLHRLIPVLMSQHYTERFEVIVADQKSTDFTQDYVEGFKQKYENLRFIQLPQTLRHITLRKIAITLGIKASRSEWVIVVNPETVPTSKFWLENFSRYLNSKVDFVSAYYNYYDDETLLSRRALFERIKMFNVRVSAWRTGSILGCETANFAVRKDWFLAEDGFSDNLNLPFGEESLFVNHHATVERSRFVFSPQLQLEELNPTADELKERRIQNLEVQCHLRNVPMLYSQSGDYIVSLLVYVQLVISFLYLFIRIDHSIAIESYDVSFIYVDILFISAFISYCWGTLHFIGLSLKALNVTSYKTYTWIYDLMFPFHNFSLQILRMRRRKKFVRDYM